MQRNNNHPANEERECNNKLKVRIEFICHLILLISTSSSSSYTLLVVVVLFDSTSFGNRKWLQQTRFSLPYLFGFLYTQSLKKLNFYLYFYILLLIFAIIAIHIQDMKSTPTLKHKFCIILG